jgi:phosphohistidine phosphatase
MPRLLLLRHAKAERSSSGGDHERALSTRGRADAAEIGKAVSEQGGGLDLILCSTSLRTRQTWEGVRPALAKPPKPRFLKDIYEPDGDYIPVLRDEAGDADVALLIGHNPAIQVTALRLAESITGADGTALANGFPTAALAVFSFEGDWDDLAAGAARLSAFIRLRESEGD